MSDPTTLDPDDDDARQGVAEIERYLASHADQADPWAGTKPTAPDTLDGGDTRRVRRIRAQLAEARQLAGLYADETPLLVDSTRVRRRRKAAHEAARLHQLAQDPTMLAWQAARVRRLLTATALTALTLALAWSTAGVQGFAADGAPSWSPAWLFAWLVEPFMSLALLTVVGARAYMGTRGQPITSRTLARIEWLFLGLTVGMNAWRYLPGIADSFSLSRLVLHLLGPVVAVAIVTALPVILAAFAGLDHGGPTRPLTRLTYRQNTPVGGATAGPDVTGLLDRVRRLIDAGTLPAEPSAHAIRKALSCGMDDARAVRDALRDA